MKAISLRIVQSKKFEVLIIAIILLNSGLIGVQTSLNHPVIDLIQNVALGIFILEIFFRMNASDSIIAYFSDGWNVFDFVLVALSLIPESIFSNISLVVSLRVLRVFRVLRLLKIFPEVKIIIAVLARSFSSLTFNALFFIIFMYLFSVIGITLFKLPNAISATPEVQEKIKTLTLLSPNAPGNSPDPYGDLPETWFTLFRILTGEDWTDLRYNLQEASKIGLIAVNNTVITIYHVLWYVLSAFLLLNLLVGAILNNYQIILEEKRNGEKG
jgi:voltage-gated sodium channel